MVKTLCARIFVSKVKKILSSSTQISLEINALLNNIDFYTLIACYFGAYRKGALCNVKTDKAKIHDIVLVDGSITRITLFKSFYKISSTTRNYIKSINSDEIVAYGTAVQVTILHGDKSEVVHNPFLSLGIETADSMMTACSHQTQYDNLDKTNADVHHETPTISRAC
ncbi:Heat shock protein 70 kDa [Temnothorax longispinosus]|uniref:Heat shock protein 70 kDa n=1 Tax=Temnothorax longispinosus TaxID=300112 RepID=A0A4S2JAD2_9HYME|nr:Heat shock protein 70 kDa [Temnothorax longispinosus]